jgi:hypothetical protein
MIIIMVVLIAAGTETWLILRRSLQAALFPEK